MKHHASSSDASAEKSAEHHGRRDRASEQREKHAELNDRLSAIYKNENGELPDMQHIVIRRSHFWVKTLICILLFGIIGSGGAWAYFFVFKTPTEATAHNVSIAFSGPTLTDFGAPATYTITYSNNSNQTLTKSSLALRFPVGFVLTKSSRPAKNTAKNEWDLGTIEPGERGTLTITGLLYGANRDTRSWRAFLSYQGATLNAEVQETASFETTIVNSPYAVRIDGPATVAPGTEAAYTFTVDTNESSFGTNVEIAPTWPENFAVMTSSPALSKTLRWNIPKNSPSSSQKFVISGRFAPSSEKSLAVKANLLVVLPETNQSFAASSASLVSEQVQSAANGLALAINGSGEDTVSATPGDTVNLTLSIKNTTANIIKDGTVRLIFQAPSIKRQSILNWAKISDKLDGDLRGEQVSDSIRQATISWNKKHLSSLGNFAPGDEATISLSVPIKDTALFDLGSIKERTIAITGGLSFTDASNTAQTLALARHAVTLGADLSIEGRHQATTDAGTETHALTWILSHSFGGLKNIKVSAEVFPDVVFTQSPPAAGISTFDPATKRLTWVVSDMPESVDLLAWSFNLAVAGKKPGQNTLISKVTVEAEDDSGQKISREIAPTPLSSP